MGSLAVWRTYFQPIPLRFGLLLLEENWFFSFFNGFCWNLAFSFLMSPYIKYISPLRSPSARDRYFLTAHDQVRRPCAPGTGHVWKAKPDQLYTQKRSTTVELKKSSFSTNFAQEKLYAHIHIYACIYLHIQIVSPRVNILFSCELWSTWKTIHVWDLLLCVHILYIKVHACIGKKILAYLFGEL